MKIEYLNLYNNLIKLTSNKKLYDQYKEQDTFNDRLTFFLIHFAFFLKKYKNKENKDILQEIYDFNFRQLELSLREIGYGDQSINKKMKDIINLFHFIISEIHFWDKLEINEKKRQLALFIKNLSKIDDITDYFNKYYESFSKKTLNSYLKSVSS